MLLRKVLSAFLLAVLFFASPPLHATPQYSDLFLMTNDYQVGVANQLLIIIKINDGFKYNGEYPSKVRVYERPTKIRTYGIFEKDHFLEEKDYVIALVPFVPLEAGTEKIKLRLSYSVCDSTRCLVENVRYEAMIEIYE
tara:strand:+ start:706 stop:1122 length:417 start_codon:yes stop_codon:yes gene_type:complete